MGSKPFLCNIEKVSSPIQQKIFFLPIYGRKSLECLILKGIINIFYFDCLMQQSLLIHTLPLTP